MRINWSYKKCIRTCYLLLLLCIIIHTTSSNIEYKWIIFMLFKNEIQTQTIVDHYSVIICTWWVLVCGTACKNLFYSAFFSSSTLYFYIHVYYKKNNICFKLVCENKNTFVCTFMMIFTIIFIIIITVWRCLEMHLLPFFSRVRWWRLLLLLLKYKK